MDARIKIRFPPKLDFLFKPMRYKVAWGGRGSAKSWSFARALILKAASKPMLILCTREVQKSIKQSVHKLLSSQIKAMGLNSKFQILDNEIRGVNGSQFIFSGLSDQTSDSIKSFEGVDIAWVEEARSVSKRSWDILIPTIRKDDSEIWVSFNPELESDETYKRFVTNKPDDCITVKMNYSDNPWFNDVLEKERLRCKEQDPDGYDNIWEGKCLPAVVGAIYFKEVAAAEANNQICNVPYDPLLKVHVIMDLGWNDSMSIALVQRVRSEIRVIEYIEDNQRTLDSYSVELKDKKYNWGTLFLPHDGKHKDYKSGKSAGEIMTTLGWQVEYTENLSVADGIRAARLAFRQTYFDKRGTNRLVECLKRYRRHVSQSTNEAGQPVHDEYSHGADCFRYIVINAEQMLNAVQSQSLSKIKRANARVV